ncbi:MAG: hypothetical protein AAB555_00830 [Patescibacteria group bacterium]
MNDWLRILRNNVVIRSVFEKEEGSTRFRSELLFMGEGFERPLYHATIRSGIGRGQGYMNVERYTGPICPFLGNLFNRWFGQEMLVVAHEWLKPATHLVSVSLFRDTDCWAFFTETPPYLLHYYGMIYKDIVPGDANDKYPPRKNVPEADWHIFGRRFNAFLKQQEQLLFERATGILHSSS